MGLRPAFLIVALAAACNPLLPEPDPLPNPGPAPDAVPCHVACERLSSLRCEESEPTPDGTTCTELCESVEESGVVRYPTGCVAAAKTCAEAVACE
jgi:hypothetical protein